MERDGCGLSPEVFLIALSHTCDLSVIEDGVALISVSNLFQPDAATATAG